MALVSQFSIYTFVLVLCRLVVLSGLINYFCLVQMTRSAFIKRWRCWGITSGSVIFLRLVRVAPQDVYQYSVLPHPPNVSRSAQPSLEVGCVVQKRSGGGCV